jgi:hypothetical protein
MPAVIPGRPDDERVSVDRYGTAEPGETAAIGWGQRGIQDPSAADNVINVGHPAITIMPGGARHGPLVVGRAVVLDPVGRIGR